jgi:hypothetical protein
MAHSTRRACWNPSRAHQLRVAFLPKHTHEEINKKETICNTANISLKNKRKSNKFRGKCWKKERKNKNQMRKQLGYKWKRLVGLEDERNHGANCRRL